MHATAPVGRPVREPNPRPIDVVGANREVAPHRATRRKPQHATAGRTRHARRQGTRDGRDGGSQTETVAPTPEPCPGLITPGGALLLQSRAGLRRFSASRATALDVTDADDPDRSARELVEQLHEARQTVREREEALEEFVADRLEAEGISVNDVEQSSSLAEFDVLLWQFVDRDVLDDLDDAFDGFTVNAVEAVDHDDPVEVESGPKLRVYFTEA